MTPHDLVLASASPRRRELLVALGLNFTVDPSDIDESLEPGRPPEEQVRALALAKATEVAMRRPAAATIIGADTLVVLDGTILGKPAGAGEAEQMLRSLRAREHQVATGVAVLRAGAPAHVDSRTTRVRMRDYSDAEIRSYVARGEPLDKAGGYAIQDLSFRPVEHIEGCYCNVVGLPVGLLLRLLAQAGVICEAERPNGCAECPDWVRPIV